MNSHDEPRPLGIEPEDLDGHTIEELSDYLDSDRTPTIASIEESAGCRIALDALSRLRSLAPDLIAADTAAESDADDNWVQGILSGIALDARAGRRIPISIEPSDADVAITEGAVRGLIRSAETSVPGILVGRSRLDGDVTVPGEPVHIRIDVSVPYGAPMLDLVGLLRAEISARLAAHTTLNVAGIDMTVSDVRYDSNSAGEDR